MIGRMIRQFVMKPYELYQARQIDTEPINTVGIILGPYRNLTTLTASILMLHPNCQVLNHAGMRSLQWRSLNFMRKPTRKTFERFVRWAIYISGKGIRGNFGGSITYSHAFQHSEMNNLYKKRFGDNLIKDKVNSLVWKESLRIANFLRNNNIEVAQLLDKFPELRFLQPVRNPIDCAKSCIKTEKNRLLPGLDKNSGEEETISAILDEYKWFLEIRERRPEKYFYFMQYDFDREMLINLTNFLDLEIDEIWIQDALNIYEMRSSYKYSAKILDHYKKEVKAKFQEYPQFAEELLKFVN